MQSRINSGEVGMETRSGQRLDVALPGSQSGGVMLPYELWLKLVEIESAAVKGNEISVRLFSGEIIQGLFISAYGEIAGRSASGARAGDLLVARPPLTFKGDDIEAVQVPASHFWQRPRWLALNPHHPARKRSSHEFRPCVNNHFSREDIRSNPSSDPSICSP
jgi:hypothetical protein